MRCASSSASCDLIVSRSICISVLLDPSPQSSRGRHGSRESVSEHESVSDMSARLMCGGELFYRRLPGHAGGTDLIREFTRRAANSLNLEAQSVRSKFPSVPGESLTQSLKTKVSFMPTHPLLHNPSYPSAAAIYRGIMIGEPSDVPSVEDGSDGSSLRQSLTAKFAVGWGLSSGCFAAFHLLWGWVHSFFEKRLLTGAESMRKYNVKTLHGR